jgi:hypothetical protein
MKNIGNSLLAGIGVYLITREKLWMILIGLLMIIISLGRWCYERTDKELQELIRKRTEADINNINASTKLLQSGAMVNAGNLALMGKHMGLQR